MAALKRPPQAGYISDLLTQAPGLQRQVSESNAPHLPVQVIIVRAVQ